MPEIWYRYVEVLYSTGYDELRDCSSGNMLKIELHEYEVIRRTPKGAWIDARGFGDGLHSIDEASPKFVLLTARKRFALPTKEEALESFIARKKRQAGIYRARAAIAERAIETAQAMIKNPNHDGSEHWMF